MEIETFECYEVAGEGHPEVEDAARQIIEDLELEGQKFKSVDGTIVRMPYPEITKDERFVYKALCPKVYKLEEYSRTPIPLRVLEIAKHAKTLFTEVYIWDLEDVDLKDPVLLGQEDGKIHLLARWGETLDSYSTMKDKAIKITRQRLCSELRKAKIAASQMLVKIENSTDHEDMMTSWSGEPKSVSFNCW